MFVAASSSSGGASPTSAFVTRDPATGNLMLNGQRFRFGGANAANDIGTVGSGNGNGYGGTVHSGSYITPHAQVDAYLNSAVAMHLGVIKAAWSAHTTNGVDTVEPSLGVYNAAALDPLDYLLSRCATLGIKVVIPLAEQYTVKPWYVSVTGGTSGNNDEFYTRTATINAFKNHISFVLDHVNPYTGLALSASPAVLCWQIGNEFLAPSISEAQYVTWANDIVNHIKVVKGAQQLVQDGHYGPYGLASGCDIYDQHAYDQYRTPSFLIAEAQACHAAGKAYFVGEFDWTDSAALSGAWRLDQQLDAWERSTYIDGGTFWDLLAPLTNWNDGYTLHYPGDNTGMQTRGDELADHALRMAGITPGTAFLLDTFTGSNGTTLESRPGEMGTWAKQNGWAGTATIQANRLWAAGNTAQYYASGVPSSSDYSVRATIYTASLVGGAYAGVLARAKTLESTGYAAFPYYDGSTTRIYLKEFRNNSGSNMTSALVTDPIVGINHTIELVPSGSGLSVLWDGAPVITATNSDLPAAGRAGILIGGGSPTTGFHLDQISAA